VPPPQDTPEPTNAYLGWKLESLGRHVDDGFARVEATLADTDRDKVDCKVYEAQRETQNEKIAGANAKAGASFHMSMWAVGIMVACVLGAIAVLIGRLVTA